MASAPSPTLTPSLAPALNRASKPKRSVSFVTHAVVSPAAGSEDQTPARSSFRPGRRPGYVRKGPVVSDSDEDDDDIVQEEDEDSGIDDEESSSDSTGHRHDDQARQDSDRDHEHSPTLRLDAFDDQHLKISQQFRRTVPSKTPTRLGQNYVRKAPVNSDTESDEDDINDSGNDLKTEQAVPAGAKGVASLLRSAIIPSSQKDEDSGSDSAIAELVGPLGGTHLSSKPGQNYVRRTPVNSDTESDEDPIQAAPKSAKVLTPPINSGAFLPPVNTSPSQFTAMASPGFIQNPLPNPAFLANSMPIGSASSNIGDSSAAASLANSMAMYQQQQQEMMMIMQQQQIQIATMHQQQQAYQLLVLQQQQQHQQQLQAMHFLHSRGNSANGSLMDQHKGSNAANSDDDDDVPLGEKQQQLGQLPLELPQLPQLPQLPLFAPLLETPQTPPSSLAAPSTLHSTPIVQASSPSLVNLQSIYPPSSSPSHSFHSGYLEQPYHPIPSSSPLLHSAIIGGHPSPNVRQTTPQPRLADFIEEEEERMRQEQMTGTTLFGGANRGGVSLLTSGFPAGYRNSVGSMASLSQSHGDSLMPPRTAGMLGFSPSSPVMSAISLPYNSPQQPFYVAPGPAPTLIHVEPKPPPPQTGLLGAISAMERDKKLAKAHGTNQLQYQHQQYQQHLAMEAEKERWLQEQRRMVWEQQQRQQQQPISYDEEEDNRPLGANGPLY